MTTIDAELLARASEDELAALDRLLELDKALESPAAYAQYVDPTFVRYRHVDFLDDVLVDLVECRSGFKKLMIWEPPRHGKSHHTSKFFPAWFETKYPTENILFASYEHDFAAEWSQKAKDLVAEHPEFGVTLKRTRNDDWTTSLGGQMLADGVGGGFTGRGGNVLVDDPIKNATEANSETDRRAKKNWWESTMERRLNSATNWCIVIQTRWHEDDLSGWLLERDGEWSPENPNGWVVVRLPALAEENDPLGRAPGEALCPERFTTADLEQMRDSMDPYWWNAMYQQQPINPEGNLVPIEKFVNVEIRNVGGDEYYVWDGEEHIPVKDCIRVATIDLAATTKNYSDWSVGVVMDVLPLPEGGRKGARRAVVVHVERERIETGEHMAFAQRLLDFGAVSVWIEKQTYGLALLQAGRRAGMKFRELESDKDKVSRALEGSGLLVAGRLGLLRGKSWAPEFLHEMSAFPTGRHDDQVDAWSYACRLVEKLSTAGVRGVGLRVENVDRPGVGGHVDRIFGKRGRKAKHSVLGGWRV